MARMKNYYKNYFNLSQYEFVVKLERRLIYFQWQQINVKIKKNFELFHFELQSFFHLVYLGPDQQFDQT
jgi:hypothetical protein